MSTRIERYAPVLDIAIPVIEELVETGEALVTVPTHRQALGLLVDLNELVFALNHNVDREITFGRQMRNVFFPGERNNGVRNRLLRFLIGKGDFDTKLDGQLFYSTIIDCNKQLNYKSRVAVEAKNSVKSRQTPPIARMLKENEFPLPVEVPKIRLDFAFQTMSGFSVDTHFQDFPALGGYERKNVEKGGSYYPVSSRQEHLLDQGAYEIIQTPVFWFSWSQYTATAINILAGMKTLQEVATYRSISEEDVSRHVKKAREQAFRMIDCLLEGRDPREAVLSLGCPPQYVGLSLKKPLKTLAFFTDGDRIPYMGNLVNAYNDARGRSVTPTELCRVIGRHTNI